NLSESREDLPVIDLDANPLQIQRRKYSVIQLDEFHLLPKTSTANHISIALIKLPEPPLLRAVGSPHRLDLVALERKFQFMLVLHHISRKRDRQIVAQGLFTDGRSELQAVFLLKSTGISLAQEIPGV